MMNLLRRLLGVYPGEGKKVIAFSLLTFLSSFAISGGKTLGDGRFLEEVGPSNLGLVYLLTSLTMLGGALLLLFALNRLDIKKIFSFVIMVSAGAYGSIAILLMTISTVSIWYGLKIIADTLNILLFTGVWTYIDHIFPLQEAKRLYGLFNASFILGLAAGGAFVSLGINSLETSGLLLVLTGILSFVLLMATRIKSESAEHHEPEPKIGLKGLVGRIITSRFTLFFLLFNVFIAMLEIVTEFSCFDVLQRVFASSEKNEITRFLGTWRGWIYVANITFGTLLYGRLVKRIGINFVSLIPSGAFFLLFLSWPTLSGLLTAVLGLVVIDGILVAIDDPNFNLLIKAVPTSIRNKFRILTEHFVEPIGMLFSSLLLMQFKGGARWIGLGLAVCALGGALFLRKSYAKAVYANLQGDSNDETIEDEVVLQFNETDEECRTLNRLAIEGSPHHFESILSYLDRDSLDIKRAAMGALARLATPAAARHTKRLIFELTAHEDRQVRSLCLLALRKTCKLEQIRPLLLAVPHLHLSEQRRVEEIIVGMGFQTIPLLIKITQDMSLDYHCRLLTGRALNSMAPDTLRANLTSFISTEIDHAYLYLYHAKQTKALAPQLKAAYLSSLRLIVHLVGCAGDVADCELLYRSLQHANREIHSHAVETIEKICPSKLFRLLLPLIENKENWHVIRQHLQRGNYPLTSEELSTYLPNSAHAAFES